MNNPPDETEMLSPNSSSSSAENPAKVEQKTVTVSPKRFRITVGLMIAVITVLLALVLGAFLKSGSAENDGMAGKIIDRLETCYSKECLGLMAMVKNNQNESMNPCEDFYEHACGRFHEHQVLTASFRRIQHKELENHISTLVRNAPKYSSHPKEQLRQFARACNDKSIQNEKFEDLWTDLQKRGGFPLVDSNWNEKDFDFSEMLSNYIQLNRLGAGFISVEPYRRREHQGIENRLFISPGPHWSIYRSSALKGSKNGIQSIVDKLFRIQNRIPDQQVFDEEFQKAVDLEQELIELTDYASLSHYSSDTDNIKKLSDLITQIPEIDWNRIVRKLAIDGKPVRDVEEFLGKVDVIGGRYFFGQERQLVRLATETPKSTLANYFVLRQLVEIAAVFNNRDPLKQSETCSRQLIDMFPMPAMNVFVEATNYKMENLKIGGQLFRHILDEYLQIFEECRWLKDDVASAMELKLIEIKINFAYKDYLEGNGNLERAYETLNLSETDSTWQVYMKVWRHQSQQLVEHIIDNTMLNPVNTRSFRHYAAYIPFINLFDITLPYLAYPYIDPSYPSCANFGSLATVIGHEVGHAFDELHRNFDYKGGKTKVWQNDTEANSEYEKQEQCLRDQYSAYKHPGYDFFMNGTVTRLELVGDHLGLRSAFRSFKRYGSDDKYQLPGMGNTTSEQMFFYTFAQQYCEVENADLDPSVYKYHSHPINRFRVNGGVQNMPEFSVAFGCPLGSPMNPKSKCRLF